MSRANALARLRPTARTRTGAIALLLVLSVLAPAAAFYSIRSVPIVMTANPSSIQAGQNVTVTITVDQLDANGGSVLVDTSRRDLLSSPSGSWPYTLNYPAGSSTTRSFTVTAASSLPTTTISIGSCPIDTDVTNSANWTCSAAMLAGPGN